MPHPCGRTPKVGLLFENSLNDAFRRLEPRGGSARLTPKASAALPQAARCKSATAGGSISNSSSIYDNGSLVFDSSMWTTCSASINGGGSLTQEGTGTLILTGPNTYSGGITINSGSTLQVGNGTTGGLGCTSSITNYGSLVLDTNAYYLGRSAAAAA